MFTAINFNLRSGQMHVLQVFSVWKNMV